MKKEDDYITTLQYCIKSLPANAHPNHANRLKSMKYLLLGDVIAQRSIHPYSISLEEYLYTIRVCLQSVSNETVHTKNLKSIEYLIKEKLVKRSPAIHGP